MCGRFTLRTPTPVLIEHFRLETMPDLAPRYNIAPTQTVAAVRATDAGREFASFRWGLVPSWAKELSIGSKMINARAESVAEKPSFRAAFKRRRCLVMADGYYEWQATEGKTKGKKQPFYIRLANESPFGLAGLWEVWKSPEGEPIETCSLLTTSANAFTKPIHDRMPVILSPDDYDLWLDPQVSNREKLEPILAPSDMKLRADRVSTLVNKPTNDVAECIEACE